MPDVPPFEVVSVLTRSENPSTWKNGQRFFIQPTVFFSSPPFFTSLDAICSRFMYIIHSSVWGNKNRESLLSRWQHIPPSNWFRVANPVRSYPMRNRSTWRWLSTEPGAFLSPWFATANIPAVANNRKKKKKKLWNGNGRNERNPLKRSYVNAVKSCTASTFDLLISFLVGFLKLPFFIWRRGVTKPSMTRNMTESIVCDWAGFPLQYLMN